MSSFAQNATVVLVHGAWADGTCWHKVILPLRKEGLEVTCAPIPLTSLTEDIAALQRVLKRTSGPAVLARHAYGGAVIAGPNDPRVRSLVYIAALAPAEGETVAAVFYRAKPHPQAPNLKPDVHGLIWMPEGGFARQSLTRTPDQTTILEAVQRPIAVKCIQEKAPVPAWRTKPSWFLVAEEDRMIAPETQRYMAERMGAKIRTHSVDHSPMHTVPDVVVSVILEAAQQTLAASRGSRNRVRDALTRRSSPSPPMGARVFNQGGQRTTRRNHASQIRCHHHWREPGHRPCYGCTCLRT
jgi:pimeloyl-ACP methyl ester carboxylesterase